jgi:hypothetical protein
VLGGLRGAEVLGLRPEDLRPDEPPVSDCLDMPNIVDYDNRMIRMMNQPKPSTPSNHPSPRAWSPTATFVLLAFLGVGVLELGSNQVAGAAICFALAAAYLPLRALRVRLLQARDVR